MARRNVIAKDLGSRKYGPRIVKSRKTYTRKVKHKERPSS
jgi:hypothetical protein